MGFRDLPYEERLRRLQLTTLEQRRERGDVICAFKFLKQLDQVDPEQFFTLAQQNTRGHSLKLHKNRSRLDVRKEFYSNPVVGPFNAIPPRAALCENMCSTSKSPSKACMKERGPLKDGFVPCPNEPW